MRKNLLVVARGRGSEILRPRVQRGGERSGGVKSPISSPKIIACSGYVASALRTQGYSFAERCFSVSGALATPRGSVGRSGIGAQGRFLVSVPPGPSGPQFIFCQALRSLLHTFVARSSAALPLRPPRLAQNVAKQGR